MFTCVKYATRCFCQGAETVHELKRPAAVRIPCPISRCIARFYTYMELATHADVEHRNEVSTHIGVPA
ncbi:hypothetical protein ANCCAN_18922 [Ancylostoma caninum]|uniref:C2H2-type domain-containing protein n=1 Tax=Ancylostoma caninum TaxID=29170 RepID=A0A368F5Q9_ANCCA|nr:hypothetical protein ANCCAN_26863 [Ancylostoma caninum]RCN35223.1 hypothetical protein ANCCAN_18922 [Ancylostoma caninum]